MHYWKKSGASALFQMFFGSSAANHVDKKVSAENGMRKNAASHLDAPDLTAPTRFATNYRTRSD